MTAALGKLHRLCSGSYESEDGTFFTYRYRATDGTGIWWVAYKRHELEDNNFYDEFLTCARTYRETRDYIKWAARRNLEGANK